MTTQGQAQESWLSQVEASIVEATWHKGPLNGQKILADLNRLLGTSRVQAQVRAIDKTTASAATAEIARLTEANQGLAADNRRLMEQNRAAVGELTRSTDDNTALTKENSRLQAEVVRLTEGIQCVTSDYSRLLAENVVLRSKDSDDREWLVRTRSTEWWLAPGHGYTDDRAKAHRYTWREADGIIKGGRGREMLLESEPPEAEPSVDVRIVEVE